MNNKPLKPLNEHNEEATRGYLDFGKPRPNGIACPECGEELWDSNPASVLASYPPKLNVHCLACGYRGYRVR